MEAGGLIGDVQRYGSAWQGALRSLAIRTGGEGTPGRDGGGGEQTGGAAAPPIFEELANVCHSHRVWSRSRAESRPFVPIRAESRVHHGTENERGEGLGAASRRRSEGAVVVANAAGARGMPRRWTRIVRRGRWRSGRRPKSSQARRLRLMP